MVISGVVDMLEFGMTELLVVVGKNYGEEVAVRTRLIKKKKKKILK